MSYQDLNELFTPGDGGVPPYLAGRKREQEYFHKCVSILGKKKPTSQNMIVYGPRGNGKTALLSYLEQEIRQKADNGVDVLRQTPAEMKNLEQLAVRLMDGAQKIKAKIKTVEVQVGVFSTHGKTEIDPTFAAEAIWERLRERCKKKPLILIVDEAHTLNTEVGQVLLNASQSVRTSGHPFLMVLAGTPNLRASLSKANASFWDRSKKFPMGRLSPEEARQAITVPLDKEQISFALGVAEQIVEYTHCYPYFTQIWGDCIARRIHQTGGRKITKETVKEAEAEATTECKSMYQDRLNELDNMGMLPAAESVAQAYTQSGKKQLNKSTLHEAIVRGMAGHEPITQERIMEKHERLFQLGFVWQNDPAGHYYEPGIPSLMSYVREHTLAQKSEEAVSKADTATPTSVVERVKRSFKDRRKGRSTDFEM